MLLAIDGVNSWGGINGKRIKLIIEDSKSDPDEGKRLFNEIESSRHPILYVATLSSISTAVSPLAEENGVVLIPLASTAPEITKQKEWTFRHYPVANIEVPPILFILEKLNIKDLGILYLSDEFGRSVFELLKQKFERAGGSVKSESFEPSEFDCKRQIAKLKDTEAIFSVGFPEHFEKIFKQLRQENYQGSILGSSDSAIPSIFNVPEANGAYLAAPIIYNPNYLFAKEAKERYETKYKKPFDHFAANGYDLLKILTGLLEDKEVSRENLRSLLEKGFTYLGVFGEINVNPGQRDILVPLHPAQIVEGELRYLR